MADIVDNVVGELQSMASGKSGKKKKKGAKKGSDPTMNILLAAGVIGVGYLIYKNSSGSSSGIGAPVVGVGAISAPAPVVPDNPDTIAASSAGPVTHYELEAVYF